MYNHNYVEYLRSVLGYNNGTEMYNNNNYYYDTSLYSHPEMNYYRNTNMITSSDNLENEYPEIYRIVYPMVQKISERNSGRRMTKQLLDDITDEIYENVEPSLTEVNVNIQVREGEKTVNNKTNEKKEVRQKRNPLLRDLIRILILRELGIGRPPVRPRPPFPGIPGRPPIPPRPMMYGF